MLFDLGWSELMLIGVIALVVIGPKDLPKALRVAGYWVRKAREMSREFQSSVDQMIREAELEEVHQEITKVGEFDLEHEIRRSVDPDGALAEALEPPELPGLSDPASAGESALEPELPLPAPLPEEEHADEPELPLTFPVPAAEPAEAPSAAEPSATAPEPDVVPPRP